MTTETATYTDHTGQRRTVHLSEFTANELRIVLQQHQEGHLLKALYPDEYELECDCEDEADARLEAAYRD